MKAGITETLNLVLGSMNLLIKIIGMAWCTFRGEEKIYFIYEIEKPAELRDFSKHISNVTPYKICM